MFCIYVKSEKDILYITTCKVRGFVLLSKVCCFCKDLLYILIFKDDVYITTNKKKWKVLKIARITENKKCVFFL
jgi:hypothetical protein